MIKNKKISSFIGIVFIALTAVLSVALIIWQSNLKIKEPEKPKEQKQQEEKPVWQQIIDQIEATHKGLGKLVLFEILSDIAGKCVLVVGSAGTGKSTSLKAIAPNIPREKLYIDALTLSGLKHIQKALSNANLTIMVDDLSKGATEYSQVQTVCVVGELVYSGWFTKLTGNLAIRIMNFNGSAILNCQPPLLKRLMASPEWETDIRDKVVRYYHLRYPIEPNKAKPNFQISYNYPRNNEIKIPIEITKTPEYKKALENFQYEFTITRAKEHLDDYLVASAKLHNRKKVTLDDVKLIEWLSRIFRLEPNLFTKKELEGKRKLDTSLIPLLGLIVTFKEPTIVEYVKRFQISKSRLYEIIAEHNQYVLLKGNSGRVISTKEAKELLQEIGEWLHD